MAAHQRKRLIGELRDRADRANEAYGFVLLLTIFTFVTLSVLPDDRWARMIGFSVTGFTAFAGLASSNVSAGRLRHALAVIVFAVLLAGASATVERDWIGFFSAALIVAVLLTTLGTILMRVVTATVVSFRTILGALSAYTLLGILFSYVYLATSLLQEDPFFVSEAATSMSDLVFFSYTTLTTTGYGNLLPAGEPGESFTVIEMLFGQIFLVTLVARLVSMWRPALVAAKDDPVGGAG